MPASLLDAAEAARSAAAHAPTADRTGRTALLVCRVGGTWLAFEAGHVLAILEKRSPAPVPHTPPHVLGVISYGEGALAVVELAAFLRLGGEARAPEAAAAPGAEDALALERIVVVAADGLQAGLRCEKVSGVREFAGALPPSRGVLQGERLAQFVVSELPEPEGTVGVLATGALLEALRVKA